MSNAAAFSDRIARRLHHDPATGIFRWRVGQNAGKRAGSPRRDGYWQIRFEGKMWLSHRLAWVYTFSEWPPEMLDHRSGKRDDSALVNVRAATRSLNSRNKHRHRDGRLPGACFDKSSGRWYAQITHNGERFYLGTFATEAEASARFMEAVALRDAGLSFAHLLHTRRPGRRAVKTRRSRRSPEGRYLATVTHRGEDWYLGTFDSEADAQARIDTAEALRDAGESIDHLRCPQPIARGVYRRENGTWRAKIRHEGRDFNLGTFATEAEALERYNAAVALRDAGLSFVHLLTARPALIRAAAEPTPRARSTAG